MPSMEAEDKASGKRLVHYKTFWQRGFGAFVLIGNVFSWQSRNGNRCHIFQVLVGPISDVLNGTATSVGLGLLCSAPAFQTFLSALLLSQR